MTTVNAEAAPEDRHICRHALADRAGIEPLRRLLDLLPVLKVVMLQGGEAKLLWRRFERRHPATSRTLTAIETYQTGRQAFIGNAEVREQRMSDLRTAFAEAARILGP